MRPVTNAIDLCILDRSPQGSANKRPPALSSRSCRSNPPFAELARLIGDRRRRRHAGGASVVLRSICAVIITSSVWPLAGLSMTGGAGGH